MMKLPEVPDTEDATEATFENKREFGSENSDDSGLSVWKIQRLQSLAAGITKLEPSEQLVNSGIRYGSQRLIGSLRLNTKPQDETLERVTLYHKGNAKKSLVRSRKSILRSLRQKKKNSNSAAERVLLDQEYEEFVRVCDEIVEDESGNDWFATEEIAEGMYGPILKLAHKNELIQGHIVAKEIAWKKIIKSTSPAQAFHTSKNECVMIRESGNCPFIVNYHSTLNLRHRKSFWLLMEYGDVGDLQKVLYTIKHPFRASQVKAVGTQVLSGLLFLHDKNILHGDIKPNKLEPNKKKTSRVAAQPGTLAFMAPELFPLDYTRLKEGMQHMTLPRSMTIQYDTRLDIWALGSTMLNLLFMRPPFSKPCTEIRTKSILNDMLMRNIPQEKVESTFLHAYTINATLEANSKPMKKAQKRLLSNDGMRRFIFKNCLIIDSDARPTSRELAKDPFIELDIKRSQGTDMMKSDVVENLIKIGEEVMRKRN